MATITEYMNYVIFFQDETEYQFALSVAGSNFIEIAPRDAATMFGIPYPYPSGDMSQIPKGLYFISPFTPGSEFLFPGPTGVNVDDTVLSTLIAGQAGVPASIWPAGPDCNFIWSANLVRSAGAGSAGNPPATPIAQRRWVHGFELGPNGEGGSNLLSTGVSKDSSRTIDGSGLSIRGQKFVSLVTKAVAEYRTGLTPATSWERFYFRLRKLGTTDYGVWKCQGFPTTGAGFGIKIRSSGDLHGYNLNPETDAGTIYTPTIDEWIRVDIFLKYATGLGTSGQIEIYINGTHAFSFSTGGGTGMNGANSHVSSIVGRWNSATTDFTVEYDLDDWICADLPGNVDSSNLTFLDANYSIDWLLGSHVRQHFTRSGSNVNWTTGEFGKLNNGINPGADLTPHLTSTTAQAIVDGLTDVLLQSQPDSIANILGAVAALVSIAGLTSGAVDGDLGYDIAGGGFVDTTINQVGSLAFNTVMYQPSGMIIPDEISPFSIRYIKSNDANLATIYGLAVTVEYIGVWNVEDDPLFDYGIPRKGLQHNSFYTNTTWGYLGSNPSAPVYAHGATYTGTGTYQEIILPAPAHFVWIRCTTIDTTGIRLVSTGSFGFHETTVDNIVPCARLFTELADSVCKLAVWTDDNSINTAGETYQIIAFCDPGGRFCRCTAFNHDSNASAPVPQVNSLIDPDFTPVYAFLSFDFIGGIAGASGILVKGPGDIGDSGCFLSGIQKANTGNFAQGVFNSLRDAHYINGQTSVSFWRTAEANCGGVMLQIGTYTGDGTGVRSITVTPTSGRFPIFVLINSTTSSSGAFRDPSHTGTDSSNISSGAISANGVTACAIDQITVAAALNTLNVVYNYFIICGDTAGMNNGTFYNPICLTPTGPYTPPSPPVADINIISTAGVIIGGEPPLTLLKDVSGIYTLVTGKRNDTMIDRQAGQTTIDMKIPDPTFKTGYVGG